jgi:eukaryotic-like serine/threonine-protein kinase
VSDQAPESTPQNAGGASPDPKAASAPHAASEENHAPGLGSIGAYRLIRKLGEGGMGHVWLAEQSAPVKRQVALKIIKALRYDSSALVRFDLERQALAIMDHPAIAKVFDAGSTAEGQPYFAMEYVPGLPITQYCDEKRLSTGERLLIFTKVCEGVQHAHQKAIIHRDLKPTNILVVEVDGKPVPRIIDFGLAKAISPQTPGGTLVTRAGGFVGTPGYMSPEQMDPLVADVDTRTDVYSLGVVLYELLTGAMALDGDAQQGESKPLYEVLRKAHEEEPTSPSTRLSNDPAAAALAEKRGTDARQLAQMLRGDLDWITLKALDGPRPQVWHACGAGGRSRALSAQRTCHRAAPERGLPDKEIRSAPQIRSGCGHHCGAAADRVRSDAGDRVAADQVGARPRRPRHEVYDRHVQSIEPQRGAGQRSHRARDPG